MESVRDRRLNGQDPVQYGVVDGQSHRLLVDGFE